MKKVERLVVVAAVLAAAVAAQGQTVPTPPAPGIVTGVLDIYGFGGTGWNWVPSTFSGTGGPFVGQYFAGSSPQVGVTPGSNPFDMYCLSVQQDFSYTGGQTATYAGNGFDVDLVTAPPTIAGWLVDNQSTLFAADAAAAIAGNTTGAEQTGLQLAIWSLETNSGYTPSQILTDSSITGNAATYADYSTDINTWIQSGLKTENANIYWVSNYTGSPSGQPQIAPLGPNQNIQFGTAPGPEAFLPFGLGFLGIFLRRKRARKA